MTVTAFVDESWTPTGHYILGAALVPDANLDDVRHHMLTLRQDRGHKLHFHHEPAHRRTAITASIARLGLDYIVAPSDVDPSCKPERRRRGALKNLIPQLVAAGVEQAVLESRGNSDDQRDLQMLQNLRSSHQLTTPLHLTFQPGPREPCLWVADFLCGCIAQDYAGHPGLKQLLNPNIRTPAHPETAAHGTTARVA